MKNTAVFQVLMALTSLCVVALLSCAPPVGGGDNGVPDDGMMDDGGDNGNSGDGEPDPDEMTGLVSGEFSATEGLILGTDGIELNIAANAAPSNQSITLRPLSESDLEESGLPEGGGFDQGMELLPSGTTFAAPVEISVILAHAPAIETLNVLRFDETPGMWSGTDIVATVSDDGTNATFELSGFSSYSPWNPPLPPGDVAIAGAETIAGTGLYSGQPFSVFPGYVNTMASLTYSPFGNVFALSLINEDLENPMTGDLITLAGGLHSTEVRRLDQGVIVGLVTAVGGLSGPSIYEDGTSPVPKPVTGIMYLRKNATQWMVDVYCAYQGGIFFGQAVGNLWQNMALIALITDYGTRDGYVGSVKGVIAGIAPQATIVDVTHDIAAQDVQHGAFVLWQVLPWFPAGTIHVAVVDPGVGTARRILAVRCHQQVILAPDNGLLSWVLDEWPADEVRSVTDERHMLPQRSATFHGRDILAPVAAHLANGTTISKLGAEAGTWERLPVRLVAEPVDGGLKGAVVQVDHFGNLVTNIRRDQLPKASPASGQVLVEVGGRIIRQISRTFADVAVGELVAYLGSTGLLEVAVNGGSAARVLGRPRMVTLTVRRE